MEQSNVLAITEARKGAVDVSEIKAMVTVAKMFPRNEVEAEKRILLACQRLSLAKTAQYEYKRGTEQITGASISLVAAVARGWGNVRWGWKEVETGEDYSICHVYAWDMETNNYRDAEVRVKHYRDTRSGSYRVKTERDIYELCANASARRMRKCLEEVLPSDILAAALAEAQKTLASKVVVTAETVMEVVESLAAHGVRTEQIEARLGRSLKSISSAQLLQLHRVVKAIEDGVGTPEDYFPMEPKKSGVELAKELLTQPRQGGQNETPEATPSA